MTLKKNPPASPATLTRGTSRTLTVAEAHSRGVTSRWMGLTAMTSMAAISSRILREPRSAGLADPPARAAGGAPPPAAGGEDRGRHRRRLAHDGEHHRRAGRGLRAELLVERAHLQRDHHPE